MLTIREGDREVARGDLRTPEGRAAIETFLATYCADELRGPPKVLDGNGHSFSDVARKVVSVINLSSVAALESATGVPVDPLRFRANLYVEGWPAWHEFGLIDQDIAIGPFARAKVSQADRALRRHQRRSRDRRPRPENSRNADEELRPHGLRHLS